MCHFVLFQLETTVERIKAVDSAAAMVEEILKNGCSNNGVKVMIFWEIMDNAVEPDF